ncbi:protein hunchback [Folsomia candida]|uniref:Uncharacterized protein n=1 Tax=Folsomia candida TaxID=158441 RepID=A0A226D5V3_FOLCA|nr:protein hunchback [Folsomia candida]XP_035716333.1 protein hunchback [Folsomia candida]XP_035716334.1 protein hunchback [Folsomia candida]OXA40470.1 hypothetical protein Fcan01_24724 [Folsomia candida]
MSDPSKAVVLYRGRRNSNAENIPPPSRPSSPFDQPHRSRGSRPHTLHLQYITPPFVFEYFSNPNVTVFIAARVMYTPPYPGFSQDNGGGGYGHHLPNGYIPSPSAASSSASSLFSSSQSSQSSHRAANRLHQPNNFNGSSAVATQGSAPYAHSTPVVDNSENNRSQQTIPQDNQWPQQQPWYQAPLQHYQQPMFGQGPIFGHQDQQQQHGHHGHAMMPQNQYQSPGANNPSYHFHFGSPGSYDVNFAHNNAKYE